MTGGVYVATTSLTTSSRVLVASKIPGPVSLCLGSWPCCTRFYSLGFGVASKANLWQSVLPACGMSIMNPAPYACRVGYMLDTSIQQHNTSIQLYNNTVAKTAFAQSDAIATTSMPGGEAPVLRAVIASTQAA